MMNRAIIVVSYSAVLYVTVYSPSITKSRDGSRNFGKGGPTPFPSESQRHGQNEKGFLFALKVRKK